ncbi:Rieske (2Fe-2S) protein [Pseudonocardia sp. GCM10023141]|uniref:Rieske (2Fe-2S) protein n=1 Tax=Pseudonocardia sp. GCM10023141 TaxID=3252653 RepID=UPI00360BC693
MSGADLVTVCRQEDLPPGSWRIVPQGRWGIGVYNTGREFVAFVNRCPHEGAPICLGRVTATTRPAGPYQRAWVREGDILACPWHGWEFDLSTGESLSKPVRRLRRHRVSVVDGWITLEL